MRYIIVFILISACQTSNQFQNGFSQFGKDCLWSENQIAPETLWVRSLVKSELAGSYSTGSEWSPYTLDLKEDNYTLYKQKAQAWHSGNVQKVKNRGLWECIENCIILNQGRNKSEIILKPMKFEENIWLVSACKEDVFIEFITKINDPAGIDELVKNRELLYSSFLHKEN